MLRSIPLTACASLALTLSAFASNNIYISDFGDENIKIWIGGPADPGSGYLVDMAEPTPPAWIPFTIDTSALGLPMPATELDFRATLTEPASEGGGLSDYLIGVTHATDPLLHMYFASDDPVTGQLPATLPDGVPSVIDLPDFEEFPIWDNTMGYNDGVLLAPSDTNELSFYVASVPEPATLALLALATLATFRRRR